MAAPQGEWENSLCETDCGTCMGSWFCLCFTFGRSKERMDQFPDPSTETLSMFNSACCVMYASSIFHLGWVPLLMQRGQVREKFGIQGSGCTDCLVSYFCSCCAVSQMNCELKKRAELMQKQPGGEGVYVSPQGGMVYEPPAPYNDQK